MNTKSENDLALSSSAAGVMAPPASSSSSSSSLHPTKQEGFNPVKVYAWFAAIPSLCKSIWLMAVAQHQFYLDKKQQHKENASGTRSSGSAILLPASATTTTTTTTAPSTTVATSVSSLKSAANISASSVVATSVATTAAINSSASSLPHLAQFKSLSELATELNESISSTDLAAWPDKFAGATAAAAISSKSNLIASFLPTERKRELNCNQSISSFVSFNGCRLSISGAGQE